MRDTIKDNYRGLFGSNELETYLTRRESEMIAEIDAFEGDYILRSNITDLINYLENKFSLHPPILKNDGTKICTGEEKVDINRNRGSPDYRMGTFIEFIVPFEGDLLLFRYRPLNSSDRPRFLKPLYGYISTIDNTLRFKYTRIDHNHEAIKQEFDKDLVQVEEYRGYLEIDISRFNENIKEKARYAVEKRYNKLSEDLVMVKAIGYPLKEYEGAQTTYVVPLTRKEIEIKRPVTEAEPLKPEPILDESTYEAILKIISDMAIVIERNPKAFKDLGEEDIRTFILMFLNGYYKGNATGETFNFDGKTDILIRVDGRNIFIAECKFWSGKKGLNDTIDQLLGYLSWRDTKTAIILFNNNKDQTAVVNKIPEIIKSHKNFKRQLSNPDETTFKFIFRQKVDIDREIILTILIFHMPLDSQ